MPTEQTVREANIQSNKSFSEKHFIGFRKEIVFQKNKKTREDNYLLKGTSRNACNDTSIKLQKTYKYTLNHLQISLMKLAYKYFMMVLIFFITKMKFLFKKKRNKELDKDN